jgi:uncharacterized protein (TIGR02284 family)
MDQTATARRLNNLVTALEDARLNFTEAAAKVESPQLRALLGEYAADCARALHDLQKSVQSLGETAAAGGSPGGVVRKGWIKLRAALAADAAQAALEEAEHEHQRVAEAFDQVAQDELLPAIREVVERERRQVLRWTGGIQQMRKLG